MPRLTEQEIALRRTMIGASDIGAIAGVNPYRDAVDVLNEKLGYSADGGDMAAAEWGHRLEQVVRQWYATEALGEPVQLVPCGTLRHPSVPWAGCTLDAKVVGEPRGLEVKVVGHRMVYDWDASAEDGVPAYVRAQCAWQMWCVGLVEVDVAALLGGTQARVWRIARDAELEARLIELGESFWRRHVIERVAPAIDGRNSVREYLDGRYPPAPRPVVAELDETGASLLASLYSAREHRDEAVGQYAHAQHQIIAWLGDRNATDVADGPYEFRYRTNKTRERRPWIRPLK